MGIFNSSFNNDFDEDLKYDELLETYIYDEISKLPDEKIQEFVHSEAADAMMQKGIIGKRTLVRLSKADDMERRIGMAALQIAKDKDDPLWNQLAKIRERERDILDKINKKYENKARQSAKVGQKEYLKKKIPVGFMRK